MDLPLFCQTSQKATLFYYLSIIAFVLAVITYYFIPTAIPLY